MNSATVPLQIGDWTVNPQSGEISRDGETTKVEVRTMRLLVCLAERAGEVVSSEELLSKVWNDVIVTQDSVYQSVATLRPLLCDDPKRPTYIETVPRLGYRLVAKVDVGTKKRVSSERTAEVSIGTNWGRYAATLGLLILFAAVAAGLLRERSLGGRATASATTASRPEKSIAVLPFLDLTEGMKEEEFADGMTEELIDKLSKFPELRVPSPTSSFYYKNKQVAIPEVAKSLGVVYVLDGSTRKSGGRLRVAARLVRADNAYVLWSETYDRPWGDLLGIQDEIAGEVAKALKTSIEEKR
jgi:TolB-like protein/DNA-binding winged helix-turn-helix (wHTH) protein